MPVYESVVEKNESEVDLKEGEFAGKHIFIDEEESAVRNQSEVSIPVEFTDGPITRSMTKKYTDRVMLRQADQSPRRVLDYEEENNDDHTSEENSVHGQSKSIFSTPFRETIITPMKLVARGIQDSISRLPPLLSQTKSSKIDYEIANNAFWLGIVFISLLIWMINFVGKIPLENYDSKQGQKLFFRDDDISNSICVRGYVKVGYLWGPENDKYYQNELQELQDNFDYLIHIYNPITKGAGQYIERNITYSLAFDDLIGNAYFGERMNASTKVGNLYIPMYNTTLKNKPKGAYTVRIQLSNDFQILPPKINEFWFYTADHLERSEFWNTYYIIAICTVIAMTVLSFYHFVLMVTPSSEASRLLRIIEKDMNEKNMFRNGLIAKNVYEWYSSETNYSKEEFNARVLPHIKNQLINSSSFYKTVNRHGDSVWKLM